MTGLIGCIFIVQIIYAILSIMYFELLNYNIYCLAHSPASQVYPLGQAVQAPPTLYITEPLEFPATA